MLKEANLFNDKTGTTCMHPKGECLPALPFAPMMNNKRVLQYRQLPG